MLSSNNWYWVASRYVGCDSNIVNFGLRRVSTNMDGRTMLNSGGDGGSSTDRLRPVVSLGSEVQVTASSTAAEETGTPHTITQY